VKGELGVKLLKLDLKLDLLVQDREIRVTKDFSSLTITAGKNIRNNVKVLQSKTKTLIKKAFFDVSRRSFKKLKLVGVGFRVTSLLIDGVKLLKFDIGYSHSVYYRIPNDIIINVIVSNRFIVIGTSSDRVAEVASIIRQLKLPDLYKGKGILYEDEEIVLKKVKKS
jgi:large subunit ribosomal protein L6